MAYAYLDDVRASSRLEGEPRGKRVIRWLTGLLMISHGLIHALGPISIWGIADIQGFSGNASLTAGDTPLQLLALGWLAATAIFVVVGVGLIAGTRWWAPWAMVGAIISQIVIAIWWTDAAAGTIPNLLIAVAAMLGDRVYPPLDSEL